MRRTSFIWIFCFSPITMTLSINEWYQIELHAQWCLHSSVHYVVAVQCGLTCWIVTHPWLIFYSSNDWDRHQRWFTTMSTLLLPLGDFMHQLDTTNSIVRSARFKASKAVIKCLNVEGWLSSNVIAISCSLMGSSSKPVDLQVPQCSWYTITSQFLPLS